MSHSWSGRRQFPQLSRRLVTPYWKKARGEPRRDDITATMVVMEDSFDEFVKFAEKWRGPISATLHITAQKFSPESISAFHHITQTYSRNSALYKHVDIHLIVTPLTLPQLSLVNINMDRNMARFFARSDFVLHLEPGVFPMTNIHATFRKESYLQSMRDGDVFVLPVFAFANNLTERNAPTSKRQVIHSVDQNQLVLFDNGWELGTGPTCYDTWRAAKVAYAVVDYEFHYEPTVVMAKDLSAWCPERLMDNSAACLYGIYLGGAAFWVLPEDYAVLKQSRSLSGLSTAAEKWTFESMTARRLFKKYRRELCVRYGRQLNAMGQWEDHRSDHVKQQCAWVLESEGRKLFTD